MKKMIYEENNKIELLYNDIYKEYHFYIISYGTHPCCYIEIPSKSKFFKISYMDIESIDAHGGLTYSSDDLRIGTNTVLNNSWFIGWDYAHLGDYIGYFDSIGKKWTTNEMIEECKNVINQIIDFENGEIQEEKKIPEKLKEFGLIKYNLDYIDYKNIEILKEWLNKDFQTIYDTLDSIIKNQNKLIDYLKSKGDNM